MPNSSFYSALARSILAGEAKSELVTSRLRKTLGRNWRWARGLADRYVRAFESQTRPRLNDVVAFLRADDGLHGASARYKSELRIADWLTGSARMQPVSAARAWPLPKVETVEGLAAWFGIGTEELQWFADLKRLNSRARGGDGRLSHYYYRILTKNSGNFRLIEAPKKNLKRLQRVILSDLLEIIPSHPAVHGFIKGRSIMTFTAPHLGKQVVLRMDLQDFFPSISQARVQALFRTAGYPDAVANLIGGLCTNAAPRRIWRNLNRESDPLKIAEARHLYALRHLPQGAPSSPALANVCAFRADCRLKGLAEAAGATYTRYADDLAFSGGAEFERGVERFASCAAAILLEEGFAVNHRKTRVMRQGVRQHLAGLVVNERINVRRSDFDRLKAILTNCARLGPGSQNRDGHPAFRQHLAGRVSFVASVNPARGARLQQIFDNIQWS